MLDTIRHTITAFFLKIVTFVIITSSLYAQPEFKISIDQFKWESAQGKKVNLTIFFVIKNVGNESGQCEDLNDLYLDCSAPFSYHDIRIIGNGTNMLSAISAGSSVDSYITFEVPKDADNLTLRFLGGASRFITESYSRWMVEEKKKKFEILVSEGDLKVVQNYPEEAVNLYKSALEAEAEKSKKDEVKKKLGSVYEQIGDKFMNDNIRGLALDNYKFSHQYHSTSEIKEKIAAIYKQIGDEKYDLKIYDEALPNYEAYLLYKEDVQVRTRRNELAKKLKKKSKKGN
ncbi:MAG: hypothetical protein K8I03_01175 [Ignavibacteria bacterium]|nr:hypothetical protein [Ignavibacteria bacterium]